LSASGFSAILTFNPSRFPKHKEDARMIPLTCKANACSVVALRMRNRALIYRLMLACVFLVGISSYGLAQSAMRPIVFMTDFDTKDDAVGICRGVMDGVAPGVRIFDITHQVTPFDIGQGARYLAGSAPYFPKNAVFVVVVDPGVGSTRKAIIAKSMTGQYFVLPDNGLLTLFLEKGEITEAREITNPDWMIGSKLSSTFHGRDIFSPAGAHLARGDDWTKAGPTLEVAHLVRLDLPVATIDSAGLHGQVIGTDGPFGNLVLNVPGEMFFQLGYRLGDNVPITLGGQVYSFPLVRTFSDVAEGKPLFFIDSRGRLSIGLNLKNFAEIYKITPPVNLVIPRKP
jgi:S-adenosylmethionine hydrolase